MNLTKIKKQLGKINRTLEFLSEEDELTKVEKDLLLDYVRALYATIKEEEAQEIDLPEIPEKEAAPVPAVVEEVVEDEVIEEIPTEPKVQIPEEIQALFHWVEAEELGDKLSRSPIADLTKAFSINERIFTINELFGGNNALFTEVLDKVNQMPNYDEAVEYLSAEIAINNDWQSKDLQKKALKFIHIIQRRFA